jgi:ribosomal protein S18 acetylase RimI-like enzyme
MSAKLTPKPASRADLPAIVAALSSAFADDPVTSWLVRTDAKRAHALRSLFHYLVTARAPAVEAVDVVAEGRAAAVWLPPVEGIQSLSLREQLGALPRFLGICGLGRIRRAFRLGHVLDENHPKLPPHAYLAAIGVHQSAQGQGLGGRLLQHKLRALDAAKTPAFLESSTARNRALYLRHDFEVMREIAVAPDGPKIALMWRDPR